MEATLQRFARGTIIHYECPVSKEEAMVLGIPHSHPMMIVGMNQVDVDGFFQCMMLSSQINRCYGYRIFLNSMGTQYYGMSVVQCSHIHNIHHRQLTSIIGYAPPHFVDKCINTYAWHLGIGDEIPEIYAGSEIAMGFATCGEPNIPSSPNCMMGITKKDESYNYANYITRPFGGRTQDIFRLNQLAPPNLSQPLPKVFGIPEEKKEDTTQGTNVHEEPKLHEVQRTTITYGKPLSPVIQRDDKKNVIYAVSDPSNTKINAMELAFKKAMESRGIKTTDTKVKEAVDKDVEETKETINKNAGELIGKIFNVDSPMKITEKSPKVKELKADVKLDVTKSKTNDRIVNPQTLDMRLAKYAQDDKTLKVSMKMAAQMSVIPVDVRFTYYIGKEPLKNLIGRFDIRYMSKASDLIRVSNVDIVALRRDLVAGLSNHRYAAETASDWPEERQLAWRCLTLNDIKKASITLASYEKVCKELGYETTYISEYLLENPDCLKS